MIRVFADHEAMSRAAADLFVERARLAASEPRRFRVALAGGATPRRCYELLAAPSRRDRVPWAQVDVFWGDERCVPLEDARSNYRMAREALLDQVSIPAAQIHPLGCTEPGAARRHHRALEEIFGADGPRFDLVLLGLGDDGHTASLIPGTDGPTERSAWLVRVRRPGEDFDRLSLTAPVLNRATLVVFLVSGADKAAILAEVVQGPAGRYPAQLVAPEAGDLLWLIDAAAARELEGRETM